MLNLNFYSFETFFFSSWLIYFSDLSCLFNIFVSNYRPTMCYGDSGGPTFVKKKGRKYKKRTYKVLKAVNSIMDDLCQQFMIGSSISSNKAWILENIQNKADLAFLTRSNRKRRKNTNDLKSGKQIAN